MSDHLDRYAGNISSFQFPYIETEYEYRVLTVERRGRVNEDRWAILDGGRCYQPKGRRWAYERSNSSRTDKFMAASRMTLEEALPLAERLAKKIGKEWDERLARRMAFLEAKAKRDAEIKKKQPGYQAVADTIVRIFGTMMEEIQEDAQ